MERKWRRWQWWAFSIPSFFFAYVCAVRFGLQYEYGEVIFSRTRCFAILRCFDSFLWNRWSLELRFAWYATIHGDVLCFIVFPFGTFHAISDRHGISRMHFNWIKWRDVQKKYKYTDKWQHAIVYILHRLYKIVYNICDMVDWLPHELAHVWRNALWFQNMRHFGQSFFSFCPFMGICRRYD